MITGRGPSRRCSPRLTSRTASSSIDRDDLHRGGTVASIDGSSRAVLDAALSSPSGRGVIVDGDGRLLGTVTAAEVVAALEEARVSGRRTPEARGG